MDLFGLFFPLLLILILLVRKLQLADLKRRIKFLDLPESRSVIFRQQLDQSGVSLVRRQIIGQFPECFVYFFLVVTITCKLSRTFSQHPLDLSGRLKGFLLRLFIHGF